MKSLPLFYVMFAMMIVFDATVDERLPDSFELTGELYKITHYTHTLVI